MVFNTGAALLDAVVLAVVGKEDDGTYGYKITQDVRKVLDISESTMYPVLRRLQKDGCLAHTTRNSADGTGGITRLQNRDRHSFACIGLNGKIMQQKSIDCLTRRKGYE